MREPNTPHDVLIIGGGAAGLAAATVLGRSRRSVLVIDAGAPRNAPAAGVHNFLTRDGIAPDELVQLGRAEAAGYGVEFLSGSAVSSAHHPDGGFEVTLADGSTHRARRLLAATGLVDELPDVEGLAERWGRDVVHCPYCHGWEVRDQRIAVLATSAMAAHQVGLFRQLSADITLLQHTAPDFSPEQVEQFAARDVAVAPGRVVRVVVERDRIIGVELAGGEVVPCDVIAVATTLHARAQFLSGVGVEPEPYEVNGTVFGDRVATDHPGGMTSVEGVFVAGNVAEPMAQVIGAATSGLMTGAFINANLIGEETELAVAARRALT